MQIVIDIPEEVREHIFDLANDGNEIPLGINAHMVKAIVNGTPLESVLKNIRVEIDGYCGDNRDRNDGLYIAMKIIDKHMRGEVV